MAICLPNMQVAAVNNSWGEVVDKLASLQWVLVAVLFLACVVALLLGIEVAVDLNRYLTERRRRRQRRPLRKSPRKVRFHVDTDDEEAVEMYERRPRAGELVTVI